MDRLNQFKKKRLEFRSVEARIARACEIEKRRKQRRAEDIARNRFTKTIDEKLSKVILLPEEIKSNNAQVNNRVKQLMKWKAEKELKKKIEALTKKPPFVVGIPHHKPWSVAIDNTQNLDCQHHKNNKTKLIVPTRITRATSKRLAEKETVSNANTLLKCIPETIRKNKKKERKNYNEEPVTIFLSTEHYAFHAPKGIAPVRMLDIKNFSMDKKLQTHTDDLIKNSFVSNNNLTIDQTISMNLYKDVNYVKENQGQTSVFNKSYPDMKLIEDQNKNHGSILKNNSPHEKNIDILQQSSVPAALSPFVVTKRGKSNVRDEQRERLGLNSPRNIVPTKNNITEILNASATESPKTAQYYKYLLNQETDRLHNLCENWKKIQGNPETSDDGRYIINQAIGQTILLMNKKFKRFDGLVSDCLKGNKELLVTCRDLQGFWDMMSMEIKDCRLRFEKLEKLKANSWIEENTAEKIAVKTKKQPIKKNKINGKSNMRAFIEATRKQRTYDQKVHLEFDHIVFSKNQRYYTRASAGQQNLTKTPELKLDSSISYINSDQTPGKGILKHTNDIVQFHDEFNKSAVKVNFNEVIIYDSASANRISENYKNKTQSAIVKTLNFDKNISNDNGIFEKPDSCSHSKNTSKLMFQDIDNMKLLSKRRGLKKPKSHSINDNNTPSTRILRSHSQFEHNNVKNITSDNIDNFTEKNIQLNLSPSKKLNNESIKENNCTSTPHRRRSARKSIKLNYSGECTACTSITKTKSDEFIC